MPEIRYYVAADGREPFARWFADLQGCYAGQSYTRRRPPGAGQFLQRGEGVFDIASTSGRATGFISDSGQALVILLTGGTTKRQQRDIGEAHAYWQDYKQGKRGRR
jgi:putative component of toxin-antitoxin plasmid stabilization module